MAEDDKYVPSQGNPKLDPTKGPSGQSVSLSAISASRLKEINDFNASQAAGMAGLLSSKIVPEGYEIGDSGVLRNIGYKSTKGYQTKEQTRMERAGITERTWGKYNRGETMDMYGKTKNKPSKKSQISSSVSPQYGQIKFNSTSLKTAASPIAGGINPWIGYGNPNICGPVRVNLYATTGGVYQTTAQEAINLGMPIRLDDTWGAV